MAALGDDAALQTDVFPSEGVAQLLQDEADELEAALAAIRASGEARRFAARV